MGFLINVATDTGYGDSVTDVYATVAKRCDIAGNEDGGYRLSAVCHFYRTKAAYLASKSEMPIQCIKRYDITAEQLNGEQNVFELFYEQWMAEYGEGEATADL